MRIFSSELGHEYSKTLTFGYCNYAVMEPGDRLSDIYNLGYLPYSGSPDSRGMFYMARGCRLYLPSFDLNSECRRVAKKFDGKVTRSMIPRAELEITDEFVQFWLDYFERAHGPGVVPRERLMHWLNFGIVTHIGVYKNDAGKVVAYTLEIIDETMHHDWYQAYAPELDKQSFGMWLLIDIARAAKEGDATYYYLGTVYTENEYKTNFSLLEYWSGSEWITDINNKRLRERVNTDGTRQLSLLYEWKQNHPLF